MGFLKIMLHWIWNFTFQNCILPSLKVQGPVIQSMVSLTSWLRGQLLKCFTILLPNTLIFLLKKWEKLLQCKSFSHFSNKKYWAISNIYVWNFNLTLTNYVVSFEQLGPILSNSLYIILSDIWYSFFTMISTVAEVQGRDMVFCIILVFRMAVWWDQAKRL